MKIVEEYPPNYEEICKVFDIKDNPRVVFTYGDTVYNPGKGEMTNHLKTHEQTHINQQREMGADEWWKRYLVDPEFRLEQELQAYRAQYNVFRKIRNWREVEYTLSYISADLASEMYGNILTKAEARALITAPKGKKRK